ncbi:peptide synthetase [Acrocarpospora pleiomorpha]|uniref:Peptide synthetase n=1 Tax=Acrocarpospora pleiomorpha TaxID=90975 RepID=A0A5M3XZU6_9ACTN|nr:condensation domain-containing protein [Acrocarpospora pleiomorpha]GES25459.1 peptide synthetase [Acrocarpospora pleiomorpha]
MSEASFAQVGMWITERMGRARSAYHMPVLIRMDGALDASALIQACEAVIRRHPVLSSAIVEDDGLPVEVRGARPKVRVTTSGDLDALVLEETLRPFDVERGPLARFTLVRLAPERHVLVFVAHHLVFDGESKDVLVRDLAAFYNGRTLPRLTETYAGFAADERVRVAGDLAEAREFWGARWREPDDVIIPGLPEQRLSEARSPEASLSGPLSSGRPSPEPRHAGAEAQQNQGWVLGTSTPSRLASEGTASNPRISGQRRGAAFAKAYKFRVELPEISDISRFELFLASVQALLFSYGNSEPVCAIDVSTRTSSVRENIGLFVNELPVASRPSPDMSVVELARWLRAELREIYRFRAVPVARAVRGLRPRTALAAVSVSYRKRRDEPDFADLRTSVDWAVFNHAVRSLLHFQAVDTSDGLFVIMQYGSDSGSPDETPEIAQIAEDLLTIMKNPDNSVSLDLRSDSEVTPDATDLAGAIREIWQEVLGIDQIGDDEDLFDLGGHSLTITQIIARMRKRLGIEVALDVFFDTPTIAGVVDSIHASEPAVSTT